MKKINLFLIFMLFTVLSFGQLTVTLPTTTAMLGQTVTIPVKIYGAGTTGTPVSSANISIVYDTNYLTYVNTVNFYTAMPASQWYYSGNYNPTCAAYTASANWMEPSLGTLAIPDGTTLYEIQFIYKGGNGLLTYCINEFTNAAYDLIPTTPVNGGVVAPLLTGPADVCEGSAGNIYVTDANMTNYIWTVNGGVITAGGGTNTNTVTVTWPTAGSHSVTVTYNSTVTAGLPVTVNANNAVSISIAASQNNICAGTQVTFTVTPTNGGSNPTYQWNKNGSNVGSNQPTYSYVPVNGDIITCVLTSGLTCTSGNPATSNSITMSVTPMVSVGVAIGASANPVTAGTAVTFTANPTNGGTSPTFQWKVNGVVTGTNTSTLTFTPVNGDQVFCLLTSSLTCVNNSVATSNVITMSVNTPPVYPLVVTLPNKLAIPGTTVMFPVKLKGASVTGTPISSANIQITYDPAVLDYDTLIGFYSAMPSSQWFFSGNNNMVSANWMEPSLLTLAIPDSTTLFEIRFTYLGGTGQLPFVTNEFTNAAFDFIPTTPYNGGVSQAPPTLSGPQTVCEGATNQIYFTDSGQPSYNWTIQGGVIDIGGPASSFVSVTWTTAGQGSISVSYPGSAVTTLPVTVQPVPVPVITGNLQICSGGSTTLDAGAGFASYLWSNQATSQTIVVSMPGTYSVVVTATNGCTGSASANVSQSTPVVVTAAAGTILCPGGTTSVTVSATGGTAPYAGTGVFDKPAGTYTFIVTDVNGCSGSASVTISEPSMFALKSTKTSTNGAEISAFDPMSNRIYTVAGPVVEYYTLDNSGAMTGPFNVPFGFSPPAGTTALPNSVDVYSGTLAVSYAIVGANNAQQPGRVAFYNSADASFISSVTVGYLPDMLAFSPDGTKVLTADEGEPNSYGQPTSFDPEGSVSVIDITGGAAAPTVTIAGFTAFNPQVASLKAAGVRIYGPGATVAQDLEPEYLTFSPDGAFVYVTLQENNAIGKLDLATNTFTSILPLGLKDHNLAGNGMDASDRDVNGTSGGGGKINIQNWPVKGMYQPDGIAQVTAGGNTYYITANEGDARDYTGFSEEVRVGAGTYVLDPVIFPNAATLKLNQNLGRLTVTNATGNNDGDTEFEEIQAFGARSFTIWNSSFTRIFDSQDQLEQVTAARYAAGFNSDGTSATFDSRSDNKGPEPEGLVVGMVNGSPYAFVGSERTGDIFIYDLSNPFAPVLKQYINTPADLGVEGIEFVPAGISPTGKALLITSAEVSKTVTVYEFGAAPVITLLGDQTVHICQNGTYTDAGATAVDRNGSNITGNIVTTNPVNTAAPGTYTVTYNVTDDCGIAANPVTRTVVVDPLVQPGITITASANQVCTGTEVVFTASAVNGGTSPVYQWTKNGSNVGSNSATYSYIPANNDVIICTLVSDLPCAPITPVSSNSITMVVNARVNVSVTIAASANPVPAGTVVTFTANAVNAGPAPVYQWKVNGVNAGSNNPVFTYTPSNGDQVFCLLTSSLICVNNPIGTSNVITMTITMPNSLLVTLPGKTAMPGDILTFPVKLTGAGINGVPISSANIQVSYDPAILDYDTLINFYSGTPASQWYFSGNNNLVSANWLESSLGTVAIPDSTVLFEIRFTYLGGNSTLPFVVNEFTNATYDLIPTGHVDGSVSQLVPTNTTVASIEVPAGTDTCFNALQVITVAGGGTTFTVQNGGNATFIAGQRISYLPGTTVMNGGHMHGYITTTAQFCGSLPPAIVSTPVQAGGIAGMSENLIGQTIRLYPNPTDGSFTVDQRNSDAAGISMVEIYQMNGIRILSRTFDNVHRCKFDITGLPTGMYFVHIRTGESTSVEKLIKL